MKLTILTSYNEPLPFTINKSSGTLPTPSGSTSIIAQYTSKALALLTQKTLQSLGNLNWKARKQQNTGQIPVHPPTTKIHSMLATYYKKPKQGSLLLSRNSLVAPIPQVLKEPCPTQQVCFLEAPNYQYQKKVHFLLHPCPKEKQRKNRYPRPLPALQDPRKPLQYPLQLSRRHHEY